MHKPVALLAIAILAASMPGCDRGKPAPVKTTGASAPALPPGLFVAAAPADPTEVKDAKGSAKIGDKVVLVGRIGGDVEPFVAHRAIFTLVDRRMKTCDQGGSMPDCKTPWDYCCDTKEDRAANSAAVQVVGGDGQPLKTDLDGVSGLKPLAMVTVVGVVAKAEDGNLVVNASGLYVAPASK